MGVRYLDGTLKAVSLQDAVIFAESVNRSAHRLWHRNESFFSGLFADHSVHRPQEKLPTCLTAACG